MKVSRLKYIAMGAILGLSFVSCEDFLDRPNEDSYNDGNYFQNDAQTKVSVNTLYNSPWYDFLSRGYYKIPEALSGNLLLGGSPYANFTVNGSDEDMKSTSNSLWAVNAQANTIYNRLKTANASESVKNTAMGECLAWKAMAYFYLVRIFGEVPIVHDNSSEIAAGNYNEKYKVKAADIYEYIIMTLEKAIELLPEENQAADAISAARPGARRENIENYIKRLEKLEEITRSYPGVETSYAIQAGREVRVMVKPEQVSEDDMVILARELAKRIESELEYPGQIKVHVLRETKVIEYAK